MKKFLLGMLFLASCLSCKEEVAAPSKTELLTSKSWKWIAGTISPAYDIFGIGVPLGEDYFSRAPKCWQDDLWIFKAPNKFVHDEGTSKCNISDPQIYTQGTWRFETGESVIKISENGRSEFSWNVTELTSTSLKIVETFKEDGQIYTFQYSFAH
jgi:hypothetical protein